MGLRTELRELFLEIPKGIVGGGGSYRVGCSRVAVMDSDVTDARGGDSSVVVAEAGGVLRRGRRGCDGIGNRRKGFRRTTERKGTEESRRRWGEG